MPCVLEIVRKQFPVEDNVSENARPMPTASVPARDVFVMDCVGGVVSDPVSFKVFLIKFNSIREKNVLTNLFIFLLLSLE